MKQTGFFDAHVSLSLCSATNLGQKRSLNAGLKKSRLFLSIQGGIAPAYDPPHAVSAPIGTPDCDDDERETPMNAYTDSASTAPSAMGDPYAAFYVHLNQTVQQLVSDALARARHNEPAAPAAAPQETARPAVRARLSEREQEVLRLIAAGDSNKMIARALQVSPHTVKRHVANILDKLGARSRSQAAAWLSTRQ